MTRSNLRLADLEQRGSTASKLMNVKVPDTLAEAIDQIADELGVPKTAVVIALLNEGLDEFTERAAGLVSTAPKAKRAKRGRPSKPLPELSEAVGQ
jgi:predicted ArsR family transcriptional regulator